MLSPRAACRLCRVELFFTPNTRIKPPRTLRPGLQNSRRTLLRCKTSSSLPSSKPASQGQAPSKALNEYYDELLDKPLSQTQPQTSTTPATPPPDTLPRTPREETLAKARVVFGSRLAGPAERRRELDASSTRIAGVMIPPRPEEPDNCCMSGCVNCVWDRYRDELEDWAAKSAEARDMVEKRRTIKAAEQRPEMSENVAASMDDDGGGSESLWTGRDEALLAAGGKGKDLFEGVPIGIREFMRTEKLLKERRAQGR